MSITNVIAAVLISVLGPNPTVNADAETTANSVLSAWVAGAQVKGLLQDFQYLNYAASFQRPPQSYGKAKLKFLKLVSRKYDSAQVLQRRIGGFKLSS